MKKCINPKHDHTMTQDHEGYVVDPAIPMLCSHCLQPTHWDAGIHAYQHDGDDAPDCFLIDSDDEASPCVRQANDLPVGSIIEFVGDETPYELMIIPETDWRVWIHHVGGSYLFGHLGDYAMNDMLNNGAMVTRIGPATEDAKSE